MSSFNECISGWSKEPQWTHDYGSFLPCFLLVVTSTYWHTDIFGPYFKISLANICVYYKTFQFILAISTHWIWFQLRSFQRYSHFTVFSMNHFSEAFHLRSGIYINSLETNRFYWGLKNDKKTGKHTPVFIFHDVLILHALWKEQSTSRAYLTFKSNL